MLAPVERNIFRCWIRSLPKPLNYKLWRYSSGKFLTPLWQKRVQFGRHTHTLSYTLENIISMGSDWIIRFEYTCLNWRFWNWLYPWDYIFCPAKSLYYSDEFPALIINWEQYFFATEIIIISGLLVCWIVQILTVRNYK